MNKAKKYIPYILFAAFYLWLADQVPYTNDDWDWGISNGIYQLFHANLNGRYMGNLFVVIMTRSEIAKTIIMGVCYFLVPCLLTKYSCNGREDDSESKTVRFLFCNGLLLTMCPAIWQQTYGWVSGFANFVISAVFLFVWIDEIYRVSIAFRREDIRIQKRTIGCFIVSVLGQLFLENVAVYSVILSICLCIIYYIRSKKMPWHSLVLMVGAVLGLVITFSSNVYSELASTGTAVDGYRKIYLFETTDLIQIAKSIILQCARLVSKSLGENIGICIAISAILLWLIAKKQTQKTKNKTALFLLNVIIIVLMSVLFVAHCYFNSTIIRLLWPTISILYYLTVLLDIMLLYRSKQNFLLFILLVWLSVPAVIAPLVVTSESGSRLFYTSNVFNILFAAILLQDGIDQTSNARLCHLNKGILTAMISVLVFWCIQYYPIGVVKRERNEIIANAIESESQKIFLPPYPNEQYLWIPTPATEERMQFFKTFYGIDSSVEIVFENNLSN